MGQNESVRITREEKDEFKRTYGIPEDKYEVVVRCFKKHANADGKITKDAFKKILAGVMHEELASQVFDSFDRDHNGTMDIREYLMMMGVSHGGTIEQKLRASFDLFDKNGDGVLSREEVRDMFISIVKQKRAAQRFKATGVRTPVSAEPIDPKGMAAIDGVVNTVFDRVDTDRSGTIDIQEFVRGFSEHPDVCGFFKQF